MSNEQGTTDRAWYLACPECSDREGPYLCHGIVMRVVGDNIWIHNHAGGSFTGASRTKEEAVAAHVERHRRSLEAAQRRVQELEAVVARAAALDVAALRVIETYDWSKSPAALETLAEREDWRRRPHGIKLAAALARGY